MSVPNFYQETSKRNFKILEVSGIKTAILWLVRLTHPHDTKLYFPDKNIFFLNISLYIVPNKRAELQNIIASNLLMLN